MKLKDRVAMVTGAGKGIGKAIALTLVREGAKVVLIDVDKAILETTKNEIEKNKGEVIAIPCDITKSADVKATVIQVQKTFGRIDILVNNAGIIRRGTIETVTEEDWDRVIEVNLKGTFLCTKAVLPRMVERKSGHIINLSSVLAKTIKYSIPYGASKAAIERFTLGLSREMKKHNVAVNALCPDFTVTEAVTTFLKDVDTGGWQSTEMWGRYAAMVAAQDAESLTGRILDEPALREIFGPL